MLTDPYTLCHSSLQEMAPLSYAFLGSYFLTSYYAPFEEAINQAALKAWDQHDSHGNNEEEAVVPSRKPYYTLVRTKNVGMTAIMLFARDPAAIRHMEEAQCGFGAADMGNKGAVGLRVLWSPGGDDEEATEVTLVAAHLAAMEWNLEKRNANWRTMMAGLTFANPRSVLPGLFPPESWFKSMPDRSGMGDKNWPAAGVTPAAESENADSSEGEEQATEGEGDHDQQPLLRTPSGSAAKQQQEQHAQAPPQISLTTEHRAALHNLSIYKPTCHLFVAGDLNYRVDDSPPPPGTVFPNDQDGWRKLFQRDQLTRERAAGRTLHGMTEPPVNFPPTYKLHMLPARDGGRDDELDPSYKFAEHRWPGWCDRVLYLDAPGWLSRGEQGSSNEEKMQVLEYTSLPAMRSSDHAPVFMRARIPVVPIPPAPAEDETWKEDPRVTLPVPIDVHAWERRVAVRRREILVGCTAFLWSTRAGALILGSALVVGVASLWYLGSRL